MVCCAGCSDDRSGNGPGSAGLGSGAGPGSGICVRIFAPVAAESMLAGGLAIYGGGLSSLDLFELRNLPGGHPDGCHCSHGAGDRHLGNVGGKTAAATFFVVLEWNWQGYQAYFPSAGKNFSNNP